ncbi:MAG: zinc ribbon domain-containing protein [Proteobacteria bacterium]|nr:zinc ribbon domain-containing protein [Pseudomonadota bacterium]
MFCTGCGTQLPEGTRFCTHCGAATGAEKVEMASAPKNETPAPHQPPPPSASVPPPPPSPPPAPSPAGAGAQAAGNEIVGTLKQGVSALADAKSRDEALNSVKQGISTLKGAKSADDVARTLKANPPLMAAGAGAVVLLIVVLFFLMHGLSGGLPSCGDSDVKDTLKKLLDENGAGGGKFGDVHEESYNSKTETRSCKVVISVGGSDDAATIHYTVEWGDKKAGKFVVGIQPAD